MSRDGTGPRRPRDGPRAARHAVFVDPDANREELNLLVESACVVTQTALPRMTESGFFEPADVDLRVDAAGHVEVLLVGHRGSPFEALAFLIDWDPVAGAYRQRRFVVDTIGSVRPELEIGGALDRDGTPTMSVARADDDLSQIAVRLRRVGARGSPESRAPRAPLVGRGTYLFVPAP